jgi:hypothetical protein
MLGDLADPGEPCRPAAPRLALDRSLPEQFLIWLGSVLTG